MEQSFFTRMYLLSDLPRLRLRSTVIVFAVLEIAGCGASTRGEVPQPGSDPLPAAASVSEPELPALLLALGPSHLCVARYGRVACRGRNEHGQLGDGTTEPRRELVDVDVNDVVSIAAGPAATCAVDQGQQVRCWGELASLERWSEPTSLPSLSGAVEVAIGAEAIYARTAEGRVLRDSWSDRERAQMEELAPAAHRVEGVEGVQAIVAGSHHACALVADGEVLCWGHHGLELPEGHRASDPLRVPDVEGALALDAGRLRTCALLTGGELRCWGGTFDVDGALLEGAIGIAVSETHVCVWDAAGRARCHGENDAGQLGDETPARTETPRNLTGVRAMFTADATSCAIAAGGPRCWGRRLDPVEGPWPWTVPVPVPIDGEPEEPALVVEGPPAPPAEGTPGIRLRRASVDASASLLAEHFGVNALVVAPADARVGAELSRDGVGAAFDGLAAEAGLAHVVWGRGRSAMHVLASAERLAAAGEVTVVGLRGGRGVDLDFTRVSMHDVARVLADVSGFELGGGLAGTVTLRVRGVPANVALEALCRLSGVAARRRGGTLSLEGGAPPGAADDSWPILPSTAGAVTLPGTPMVSLELVGVAHGGRGTHALFTSADGVIGTVRPGALLGAAETAYEATSHGPHPFFLHWRVEHVANDAVVLLLEDQRRPPAEQLRRRIALGVEAPSPTALGPF